MAFPPGRQPGPAKEVLGVEVLARQPKEEAGIPCSSGAASVRAARLPGPRILGRTGCRRALSNGRGTGVCGNALSWATRLT